MRRNKFYLLFAATLFVPVAIAWVVFVEAPKALWNTVRDFPGSFRSAWKQSTWF